MKKKSSFSFADDDVENAIELDLSILRLPSPQQLVDRVYIVSCKPKINFST